MKRWLLNRWLKQMDYEDLRELVAQSHPDKHISYDPKRKPKEVPLEHLLERVERKPKPALSNHNEGC
jgi:hypothetical protein